MKLTFIHSPNPYYTDTQMFGVHFMPVWAYTLASHLEGIKDLELVLFDDRFQKKNEIKESNLFLLSGINQDFSYLIKVKDYLRQKFQHATIVIGGPICWSFKAAGDIDRLNGFDHIFIGNGEETLVTFIQDIMAQKKIPKIVEATNRFDVSKSRPMNRLLMDHMISRYYGAVLEVSRGCPFLCEFCDIRILPDNNRSHNKNSQLIVDELDHLYDLGTRQVLLACDNFIGVPTWAEEVCDKIIQWRERTGKKLSLYTWLTINLENHPRLLQKLRLSGFDMFFIGVESFNQNSLLETAKVQNTQKKISESLKKIQSYGFIVVAGLIFGFDTDTEDIDQVTLQGLLESGLISGDPSLLTALPGTPLYRRMKLSGRLRDVKYGLGGFKYHTNIRYLRSTESVIKTFQNFVKVFNSEDYQLLRLMSFYKIISSPNYIVPQNRDGYVDIRKLLKMVSLSFLYFKYAFLRFWMLFRNPKRFVVIIKAALITSEYAKTNPAYWFYFKFWLFNWSNSIVKYSSLRVSDFNIESVAPGFDFGTVIPENYEAYADEDIPSAKKIAQQKLTIQTLRNYFSGR